MFDRRQHIARRLVSGVDLLIDVATLGEYGLVLAEPSASGCREERAGGAARPRSTAGWEAFSRSRRGACRRTRPPRARHGLERWYG